MKFLQPIPFNVNSPKIYVALLTANLAYVNVICLVLEIVNLFIIVCDPIEVLRSYRRLCSQSPENSMAPRFEVGDNSVSYLF